MIFEHKIRDNRPSALLLGAIAGPLDTLSLENRVFNIVTFATAVVAFILLIADLMLESNPKILLITLAAILSFSALYFSGRKKGLNRYNAWGYVLINCLFIVLEWHCIPGISGNPVIFGIALACIFPMYLSGKDLHWAMLLLGGVLTAIFTAELLIPGAKPAITANPSFITDRFLSIFAVALGISLMVWLIMEENRLFREKIEKSEKKVMFIYERLAEQNRTLSQLATFDQLTGVFNRRALYDYAWEQWSRAVRNDEECSVIMFDIDFFKRVNDGFGHSTGDRILRDVAQAVSITNRPYDRLGRWGGEEFLVFLPGTGIDQALDVAERYRKKVADLRHPVRGGSEDISVTISLGVTSRFLSATSSLDQLIDHADQALYKAKGRGRNRVVRYAPAASLQRKDTTLKVESLIGIQDD